MSLDFLHQLTFSKYLQYLLGLLSWIIIIRGDAIDVNNGGKPDRDECTPQVDSSFFKRLMMQEAHLMFCVLGGACKLYLVSKQHEHSKNAFRFCPFTIFWANARVTIMREECSHRKRVTILDWKVTQADSIDRFYSIDDPMIPLNNAITMKDFFIYTDHPNIQLYCKDNAFYFMQAA